MVQGYKKGSSKKRFLQMALSKTDKYLATVATNLVKSGKLKTAVKSAVTGGKVNFNGLMDAVNAEIKASVPNDYRLAVRSRLKSGVAKASPFVGQVDLKDIAPIVKAVLPYAKNFAPLIKKLAPLVKA